MSDKYDKGQESLGAFLFLLAMVSFGVFSLYLWFG